MLTEEFTSASKPALAVMDRGRLVKAGQIRATGHEHDVMTDASKGEKVAMALTPGTQQPAVLWFSPQKENGGRQQLLLYTGAGMVMRPAGGNALPATLLTALPSRPLLGGSARGSCMDPLGGRSMV